MLNDVYDRSGYDYFIDYRVDPLPLCLKLIWTGLMPCYVKRTALDKAEQSDKDSQSP